MQARTTNPKCPKVIAWRNEQATTGFTRLVDKGGNGRCRAAALASTTTMQARQRPVSGLGGKRGREQPQVNHGQDHAIQSTQGLPLCNPASGGVVSDLVGWCWASQAKGWAEEGAQAWRHEHAWKPVCPEQIEADPVAHAHASETGLTWEQAGLVWERDWFSLKAGWFGVQAGLSGGRDTRGTSLARPLPCKHGSDRCLVWRGKRGSKHHLIGGGVLRNRIGLDLRPI
jgi:hypothetical protein